MTTLDEFFTSLHHGPMSNERIGYWQYYMHEFGDELVAEFLYDLLGAVGDSVDDGRWDRVVTTIREWDQSYANWFVEHHFYTRQIMNDDSPFAPLRVPLSKATVALVSSGGFHVDDQEPYGPGETPTDQAQNFQKFFESTPTMRVIDRDVPQERIRVSHPSYDQAAVRRDINVLFPLDRMREFEREGRIGRLAQRNVSYMGLTHYKKIDEHLVPAVVGELQDQGVDAAILTPGCPGCHLTISQVARGLERAGIATATVHLDIYRTWAVERLRLPWVLFSPFFLGRLLGAPGDVERQRSMVGHCLDLLATAGRSGASHDPGYAWRAESDQASLNPAVVLG